MFGDFTFASIKGIIKDQVIQYMPSRDPCDNTIIQYLQFGKWDTTKYTIHQVFRSILFVAEIYLLRFFYLWPINYGLPKRPSYEVFITRKKSPINIRDTLSQ